jgi:hypothetical protein
MSKKKFLTNFNLDSETKRIRVNSLVSFGFLFIYFFPSIFLSSILPSVGLLADEIDSSSKGQVETKQSVESKSSELQADLSTALGNNSAASKTAASSGQNEISSEINATSPLEEIIKGENVQVNGEQSESNMILKGSSTKVIDKKEKISISLMTLLSSELSSIGDGVQAKVLVKPGSGSPSLESLRGSRIKGHVVDVKQSRKAGRAGFVKVAFDTLVLKSGKEFPIKAELTTESFKGKEAAKLVVYDAKLATLGALWGTYNSLRWSPLAAVYTNGLSVAVGAGVGVSLGLIGAVRRQGDTKTFFPGEKSAITFGDNFNIDDDALLEAELANKQANLDNQLIGLNLELMEAKVSESEEYENLLSVKVKVNNQTNSSIYPCDLLLVPLDGGDPMIADLRTSGTNLLQKIASGQSSTITLMFPVSSKQFSLRDYNLALYDPLDKSFLSRVSLSQANLSQTKAAQAK